MTYSKTEIENIIRKGESDVVEFKSFIKDPRILAKLLCAFANTTGGLIIVGIREPNEIIGCDIKLLNQILEKSKVRINPQPKISLESIIFDNKTLGLIRIEKSEKIIFGEDGVFERIGDRIVPMNSDLMQNKIIQFAKISKSKTLTDLVKTIENLTKTIEELHNTITNANSLKSKLKDYLIGGVIGAVIGLVIVSLFS